jgi:polysaccharide biosynthesis transport protein
MAQFSPALLKRHALPACATLCAVVGAALFYGQKAPQVYETSARLLLDDRTKSISELGRNLTKVPDNVPGGSTAIATQAELVKSERVIKRALASILPPGQAEDPSRKLTIGDLSKSLKIKILPATNLLEVTYQNNNPELVAQVLNAVAEATVQEDAASIRREASTVREFLEKKVPAQQSKVLEAEAIESRYRQGTGVVALENQTQSLVTSLADVETQERAVIAQLREAGTKGALLQQVTGVDNPQAAYAATRIGQDEQLKALRLRLAEVENKVIETRSRLGDQHPDLLAVVEQRDELNKLYADRTAQVLPEGQSQPPSSQTATDDVSRGILSQYINGEVDRTALEQKLTTLQAAKADLQARIASIPEKQQGLTAVTRQREETSASLKGIQGKLEEARVAEAQLISNIRILDRAVPPQTSSSPKQPVILAVAIAAGLILAVGLSLLMELMDNTLRDPKELAALTNVRLLGKLPKLPFKPTYGRIDQFLDTPHLVEPYRMLLKTIDRSLVQPASSTQPAKQSKIILVSSVMEGEGKSNLVAYLGAVAATLSYRTLVIDTDSQQAMQHTLLGVSATPGLSNAIVRNTALQDVIKSTAIDNLFLLPYGELPKRPATVMESPEMAKLLETVGQDFDLILVDTAVLSRSVDAVTLSPYTSGLILSTRPEHTRRDLLKQLLQDLQDNQIEPLGLVVNQNADPSLRQMSSASTLTIPPPRPIDARPGERPYTLR